MDEKIKLKKKNFVGRSNFHIFEHLETGEVLGVECSDKDYTDLAKKDFPQPFKEGYKWLHSEGGGIKVDTPDGRLGENEYTDIEDDMSFICVKAGLGRTVKKTKIVEDEITEKDLWQ